MRKKSIIPAVFLISLELIVGVLAIISCLSFLLELSRNYLESFDNTIISFVYSFRSESITQLMKIFTFFGGEIFLTTGIILLLLLLYRRFKVSTFNFGILLVFGTIINLLLKSIFHRHRPDYLPLLFESTYSFPSGHAMNSFIFYSCIAYFIVRNTKQTTKKIFVILLFTLLIFMIGVSRIYLGVHYPSDVLAGYIAGTLWFVLIVIVEKTAHKFKLFKNFL